MAPFPLPLTEMFGEGGTYLIYLLIGVAFGAVLEMAGFAYSPKLAAQFYFKDMTVLKVMFSGIVVAMILIFGASAVGLLDYNLVWVNPTYLWPGIVGGLIMGVGFIIGGFCPGTSIVAAATLKIDGVFFVLGTFFGIFLFGETVESFEGFWYSSYMGRYTLQGMFNVDVGTVVLLVTVMAVLAFGASEQLERIFGGTNPRKAPKWRYAAAGGGIVAALLVAVLGNPAFYMDMIKQSATASALADHPATAVRWVRIAEEREVLITDRAVQIHPGELLGLMHDNTLNLVMIDVRSETDYNLFHILDARHIPLEALSEAAAELLLEPFPSVFVVMSNDETAATKAWRILEAESIPNAYILEGGINNWIDTFADDTFKAEYALNLRGDDLLSYVFDVALGSRHPVAYPHQNQFELTYEQKVKLEVKRAPAGGGCG